MKMTITTQARQEEQRRAYYAGRETAFRRQKANACPYTQGDLYTAWQQGFRDAAAELRLDADTEWDNDSD
jgi:ribosome modulation factor